MPSLTDNLGPNGYIVPALLAGKLVRWVDVPATPTSPGEVGALAAGGGFLYVCIAANSWVRTDVTTW